MKKLILTLSTIFSVTNSFADLAGLYVGGGVGYGIQSLSAIGNTTTQGTPAIRGFVGYQIADWIGAEAGYTYISQANNWNDLGNPSATIYDLTFTPGFSIPLTPVTIYGRFGIDGVSANLNSSWFNQMFSNLNGNFTWGGGLKINIPATRVFIRAEYINFGNTVNNNNSKLSVTPSTIMLNAAYVF